MTVARECDEEEKWVQWAAYAEDYDEYVVPLGTYQDNIRALERFISEEDFPPNTRICDVGAGTGVYIDAMSGLLEDPHFTHIDSNTSMNRYAARRYENKVIRANIIGQPLETVDIVAESFDLITAINVIYCLPNPKKRLQEIFDWLKPGGSFFTIDFGRSQNSLDWTLYGLGEMFRNIGLAKTIKAIPSVMSLSKRQKEARRAQDVGSYWLHSTREFREALEEVGFEVERAESCYRGYADLAVCRKT